MGITAALHSTARMSSLAISYTSCPLVPGIDLAAIQRGSGANWWEAGASVELSLSYLVLLSPPTLGVSITRRTGRIFQPIGRTDRKSTRLNSSHQIISYAVFCLKKKKTYSANTQSHVRPTT